MAFGGGYDAIGSAPLHGNGQVTVTCSQPAIVRLGPGQHSAGTFFPRKMLAAFGEMTLAYNLFVDATYSRIWGDGTTSTFIQNVGPGATTLTIYGRIPGGQPVPVGMYQDLIVISVEW
jgi:spore coat protein U-like protein